MSGAEILPIIPTQEQEVCGYQTGIRVGGPGVGFNDGQGKVEVRDAAPGDGDVRRVHLDEGAGHSGTIPSAAFLQRTQNVVALAGARAEHANRAGRAVQPLDDGSLDMAQPHREARPRIVVRRVPAHVVAQVRVVGTCLRAMVVHARQYP